MAATQPIRVLQAPICSLGSHVSTHFYWVIKNMAQKFSAEYDRQIANLVARRRHPVQRRLIASRVQAGDSFTRIRSLVTFVSDLFEMMRRRKTHGHLKMADVATLHTPRTLERYLADLLDLSDGEGGCDFYLFDGVLFAAHFHPSVEAMHRAALAYRVRRAGDASRKRRDRSNALCETTPRRMALSILCDAESEMSARWETSVLETKQDTGGSRKTAGGVGRERPAAKREVCRVPRQLLDWGFRPAMAARHRLTEHELALGIETVLAARTPLFNKAGAVVAAALRYRSGQWAA